MREQLRDWPRRVIWTAKTHVACQGLDASAVTLARLYRRQISLGTVRPDTVVCEEISLLTDRDFECCLLPLARLGVQPLLLGHCEKPASQYFGHWDHGRGFNARHL